MTEHTTSEQTTIRVDPDLDLGTGSETIRDRNGDAGHATNHRGLSDHDPGRMMRPGPAGQGLPAGVGP
jgi:hypothetical protein